MLCERCKVKEATVHYTEVINGAKSQHYLCNDCAAKTELHQFSDIFNDEFPFGKILSGLLGAYGDAGYAAQQNKMEQVVCPTCGMKYTEFAKDGKYGCSDCYGVFNLFISDNIKKIQESDTHTGKQPKYHFGNKPANMKEEKQSLSVEEEIALTTSKLKEAVKIEDYEEAAKLRDQIKSLKERNGMDA